MPVRVPVLFTFTHFLPIRHRVEIFTSKGYKAEFAPDIFAGHPSSLIVEKYHEWIMEEVDELYNFGLMSGLR